MPYSEKDPFHQIVTRHQGVMTVITVKTRVCHQCCFWDILLQDGVDHAGHRGVDGVIQDKEGTLEQCLGAIVCVKHVEQLPSETRNVFVE